MVVSNAYKFLSSMSKKRGVVSTIYGRISKDGKLGYGAYMSWVHQALAAKYVKK